MKAGLQSWLTRRAATPGTLGCGLRGPDGKCICHSVEEICPAPRMEKILGQFSSLREATVPLAPRWTTWIFDQGVVRFVERPDGWLLGLVVRIDSDAQPKMDPLSAEFLTLQISD